MRGLLAAGLAAGLPACTRTADDGATVLKFWAMGREGEVVTALIPEFERLYPGVKVDVQQLPWTAAHEKLLTAFAGEAMPDLFQLGNTWVAELAALKAIEPLDARVAASATLDPKDYFAGIWQTNVIDGRLYGVPWYVDTRVMFYNRELLARAGHARMPATWEGWMAAMRAVKKIVGPDKYVILLPHEEFAPLLVLALQQPEELLRDGGRYGNFRSASFRRALQLYADMYREGLAPKERVSNIYHEFSTEYVSFYISGPWNIGEFRRRVAPDRQHTWATALMPGPHGPAASLAGGSSLAVASSSRHKQAAWQLVEYLSQVDTAAKFNALTGNLPPRRANWSDARLAGDPPAQAFRLQLENVRPEPRVPEWESILAELRVMGERVAHGDIGVDAAAVALDARTDRILEKRRWMLDREARR
ncbi:sugar ABC transporter substrate-binding protein [Pseudoduganella albidiflava]|uniref:Extracellular solute-binding protein n=1 Tax=Pseudoduganella albidiflava TaxID=321983 RepID=A0A411X2F0_9BURK|nr:sugar ABC transporter substrate-binding protein [Pseudoduganella albidiflava]QBI03083.1 extracellular solute-binding protein [Pseudoduganella albidiflava]GGY58891.1 sugar ABC transporter substrate-binding protein [Pseudoduganella albidiflava]